MNAPPSTELTPHLKEADRGATVPADDAALWYKDAVIYQLNVKAFFDSDGDGGAFIVGTFSGGSGTAARRAAPARAPF